MGRIMTTRTSRCVAALAVIGTLLAAKGMRPEPLNAGSDIVVVVIVSVQNPMTEISRLHLADLFMGRTSRFPNGAPAVPVDLQAGTAARASFCENYLGRSEAQMKAHWSKIIFTGRGRPPAELSNGEAMRALVAGDPRAIGYIDRRLVDSSVRIVRVR
jgi:hypothetical protein